MGMCESGCAAEAHSTCTSLEGGHHTGNSEYLQASLWDIKERADFYFQYEWRDQGKTSQ